MASTSTQHLDVASILAHLTLEEKSSLLSGADFWHTQAIPRLGVPAIMMTDGPSGLRKQAGDPDHLGIGDSVPATCFPAATTLASSWDPELVGRVGAALGREARANGVSVVLAPGVNIQRSPLGGRDFEYYSEDPRLAGTLASRMVAGIQSQGVGASLKHFAANNQESRRLLVSADVDERALREIYLAAFERVVREARPWTVMCSYNRINGVYSSQNRWLLTDVLRGEWGFAGLVVSDWGAVVDRVEAVRAGLDLEMPSSRGRGARQVVRAVRAGELAEADVDRSARRVLELVGRAQPAAADPGEAEHDAHHALAREAAAAGVVLLKNEPISADAAAAEAGGAPLLPLSREALAGALVVGEFARAPRYQGGGSSQVHPTRVDTALAALRAAAGAELPFEPGFGVTGAAGRATDPAAWRPTEEDLELRRRAVEVASKASVVLAFLGLPAGAESEGFDRTSLALPAAQVATLRAIVRVNPRVVVVLSNGAPVSVEWRGAVPALVEAWLGGQAGGGAIADVLTGRVDPSGRLAETIPLRLEDTPAFGNWPGELDRVRYGEGVLVGYRWYDARRLPVAYPFGHGLSYTRFEYSNLAVRAIGEGADARLAVAVDVRNAGERDGAEVVQVYLGEPDARVLRAPRELAAFAKVRLQAGQTRRVEIPVDHRALAYWHAGLHRWVVESGRRVVEVGASSRDVRARAEVQVRGESLAAPIGWNSTLADVEDHPGGRQVVERALAATGLDAPGADPMMAAMAREMPLRAIVQFGMATDQQIEELIRTLA